MTGIIIKRYRPEEFPRHLDFLERMTISKGTVEDWHALKSLHYKTDGKPFAPTYYRCDLDGRLVGVVVVAFPKLLLAPRHRMFPKLKPTTNTTVANQYWGRYVNNNFAVISRSVVDTQYRGVGVSYRMINLVSRMHDRPIIEIQSSMSKYNPFAMKAGFQFIRPERPKSYESALRVFQRHFRSDPGDNEAIVKELFAMSESRRRRALRDLVADYHKNSSLAKAGRNRGTTIQDIADSLVDEASIVKLLKDIHNLSFTSPLYGVYWRWKSQVTIFPDPAGAYRQHARGESDVDIFKEKGFLRVDYPKKHPPIADRVNAVNRMLMSASGETRLYIDPKCKHLIDSLEKVIYKPGSRDMDKTGGIEHSADALGYPVHRRYPVKNRVILGGSR